METPLKKLRIKRELSIYEVAKGAECAPSTVSRIERGGHGVSPDMATRLANYFGGDITEQEILYPERFVDQKAA